MGCNMKKKEFFDGSQAASYLGRTLVLHNDRPMWIHDIYRPDGQDKLHAYCVPIGTKEERKETSIPLDDPGWDFTPPSLGLLSIDESVMEMGTVYVSRVPSRMWKIGLTPANMTYETPDVLRKMKWTKGSIISSAALANTIKNIFPTIDKAVWLADKGKSIAAFSRNFAVSEGKLFFNSMGVPVGSVNKDKPELFDNFFFLREQLAEATK